MMRKTGSLKTFAVAIVTVAIICIAFYIVPNQTRQTDSVSPSLSADGKSVIVNGDVLLSIDNDQIFYWFKGESQLCDGENVTSIPDRKAFCEDRASFKDQTRFAEIIVSPDATKIGFTIESDTLSPDSVVGIFSRATGDVSLLTGYYLGNEFIGFSPSGEYFVYQDNCFEGMCGLVVKDSETLADVAILNTPEYLDSRSEDAEFVQWLSGNELEYKLGSELYIESL